MAGPNISSTLLANRPSAGTDTQGLNVMPVMNMFIILIPFLISMSAFAHLAAHELNLPAGDQPQQAVSTSDLPLVIALAVDGLQVVRGDFVVAEYQKTSGENFLPQLLELLKQYSDQPMVVAVDKAVTTADLVLCLDTIAEAGCTDVGLAAGAGVLLSTEAGK